MRNLAIVLSVALVIGASATALVAVFPRPGAGEEILASVRAAGPLAHVALALGIACVLATAAGMLWPRRRLRGLVRALGHAAFILALAGASAWFREAMDTVARIGAAVTPADTADATDAALASIIAGAAAEALALGGAGLLRLRAPEAP